MKIKAKQILFASVVPFCLVGCQEAEKTENKEHHGIGIAYIDTTVRPQDNFYQFVNGGWRGIAEIPADRTSAGRVQMLREKPEEAPLAGIAKTQARGQSP